MLDLAEDCRRWRRPDEGTGVFVVFADVGTNRGDESRHTAEGAAPDAFARDLGEEALDEVQPRGPGRGEVEVKAWVLAHPGLHGRMLVRTVVVQNEMNVPPPGCLPIDLVQEGEEFGVRVAGLARHQDLCLPRTERRETQRPGLAGGNPWLCLLLPPIRPARKLRLASRPW